MASEAERRAMRRAISLSVRALGRTSPNPIVGAVVLGRDGAVCGEGWHERAGAPHAEVNALRQAGAQAEGGTLVVTLEPCRHQGRTGPCTEAVLAAGIRRVVYAVDDPTAAGGGAAVLRAAGLDVEGGVLDEDAIERNEAWYHAVRTGRPFVLWKYAASLDGRVAAADGSSRWVTGAHSRAEVHELRDTVDAVLVGSGTVLADDPELTVRDLADPPDRQPLRVVADRSGRVGPGARVRNAAAPSLVSAAPDPPSLLAELYERGIRSVLLEGGPTLTGAFLAADCVDKLVGYVAPVVIGGGGLPAVSGPGAATLAAAQRWELIEVTHVGSDIRLTAYRLRAS